MECSLVEPPRPARDLANGQHRLAEVKCIAGAAEPLVHKEGYRLMHVVTPDNFYVPQVGCSAEGF
jgi:hypothetical protein